MTHPLAPYDALFVVSYGGPNGPDDVLPFMRNATGGRGIPDERLLEVSGHYQRFGGVSPINARNAELLDAIRAELHARDADLPVVIGNRNWHPFVAETLRELQDGGIRRPLLMFTSAFESYSGDRQYREDVARAEAEVGSGMQFDKFGPYYATDGFVQANVDALEAALDQLPDARVVFVTHSIPVAMEDASGPGPESLRYVAQHRWLADQVIARVADHRGIPRDYDLVYCSRSGSPHTPWLEPDVNDHLQALSAQGITDVVVAPIGFITDHMEVVFDLDTEAKQTAADLGMGYVRAATAGTHSAFVASLVDAMTERAAIARGERPAPADDLGRSPADPWPVDHLTCCLPKPGADPAPAICSA